MAAYKREEEGDAMSINSCLKQVTPDSKERFFISTVDIKCRVGEREVVNGISFGAGKGKFCSIIGPNGSGKTTLLRTMASSLEPVCGAVMIDDTAVAGMKTCEIALKLAYVSQNTNIGFDFNVTDYVLIGRKPHLRRFQNEGQDDMDFARRAMKITNTWNLREKNVNELSGGERQRVILARALAQDTPVILLDEPISQLDIHHQIGLMDTLREMAVDHGVTVVAVLHDLNMASHYSDQIVLINEGRIVIQGSPEEVLSSQVISEVYGLRVRVINNPETGRPLVIPIGNKVRTETDTMSGAEI
jgi:iron complex transport system ATP-binding protein